MEDFSQHYTLFLQAVRPYWAELIGAFLMTIVTNLFRIKGTQKDSFFLLTLGFYALILRDAFSVFVTISQELLPELNLSAFEINSLSSILTALTASLFMVGAFKNIQVYFSSATLTVILTLILSGVAILCPVYPPLQIVGLYLPPIYITLTLFIVGISFYLKPSNNKDTTVQSMGNGFLVLSICYGYQSFTLLTNNQQVLFLGYTLAVVLSLATQVQLLNVYNKKLEDKLQAEERSKHEVWEISPFPIVVSRLRDDAVLYMNPTARQLFGVNEDDIIHYSFSDYFVDPEKKVELLNLIRSNQIVDSFELEVHHPELENKFWIDITTRTTDWNEEIVLFSTFKDITDQRKTAEILKEQASTDPLTGLYNRRQFEILANQALHVAQRYKTTYSMAMLDIDFFKKVNDTHGHAAGDDVLVKLAETLKTTLRKSDIVARYGGEEFVVFLAQTPPKEGFIAAEHVRKAVEEMVVKTKSGQRIPITISIGISDCQTTNLEALIKEADEALYHSKENGRNQVTLFSELVKSRYTPSNTEEKEDQE